MKRAVGYIRVSTTEQVNEGISLDNQRAKIQAYCDLNDLNLVEIIDDSGKSGKNLNRDGIQNIIGMVKGKSIEAIVVYKLDRLSRKVIDILNLIETFEKNGITFHSLNEKIDTSTAIGRFFLNITASLAQMERDLISERTRDALQLKISNGQRAGQVPYGWRVSDDGNTLIRHIKEQKVIEKIRNLKDTGFSYRAICHELDSEGYEPFGKKWHPQTVKNILRKTVDNGSNPIELSSTAR